MEIKGIVLGNLFWALIMISLGLFFILAPNMIKKYTDFFCRTNQLLRNIKDEKHLKLGYPVIISFGISLMLGGLFLIVMAIAMR